MDDVPQHMDAVLHGHGTVHSHTVHSSLFVSAFFFPLYGWNILNLIRDLFRRKNLLCQTLMLGDTLIKAGSSSLHPTHGSNRTQEQFFVAEKPRSSLPWSAA